MSPALVSSSTDIVSSSSLGELRLYASQRAIDDGTAKHDAPGPCALGKDSPENLPLSVRTIAT